MFDRSNDFIKKSIAQITNDKVPKVIKIVKLILKYISSVLRIKVYKVAKLKGIVNETSILNKDIKKISEVSEYVYITLTYLVQKQC
jgi:hypothetical protein